MEISYNFCYLKQGTILVSITRSRKKLISLLIQQYKTNA